MPTNPTLMAIDPTDAGPEARRLIGTGGAVACGEDRPGGDGDGTVPGGVVAGLGCDSAKSPL